MEELKKEELVLTEQEASTSATTPAAEELTLAREAAPSLWEDMSERGTNKKVYTKDGRRKEAVYYAGPVHVLGTDSSYQEIADCTYLEEESDCYRSRQSRFQAKFNRKTNSNELFRVEKDGCSLVVFALERGRRKGNMPVPQKKEAALLYENIAEKTDYLYSVFSDRVKEDIVIREKSPSYRYGFLLESSGLEMRFQEDDRTLTFYSQDDGEDVFTIPAPYMTDAEDVRSDDVRYEVRTVNENRTVLTIIPDSSWINADDRTFPVTIDPQVVLTGSTALETYRWNSDNMTKQGTTIPVGSVQSGSSCFVSRMYIKLNIPDMPPNARIEKVTLDLRQQDSSGSKPRLCLYQVMEEITAGTCTPAIGDIMLDYVQVRTTGPATLSFDITAAYDSMQRGEATYANLVLMAEDESGKSMSYANIYGTSAITAYQPKVTVTYENNYAENAAASTTHDLGAYGRASIELQTGTLMITSEDMTWQGNRMPVSIRHTFCSALAGQQYTNNSTTDLSTADFSAMHLGYGWKLNYMQSIVPKTFTHEGTVRNGYVYTDESGAAVYLMESTKDYFKREYTTEDGTTEEYYIHEDLDGSGYMYDPYKRELYYCADTYTFDTAGRLIQIADQNENTLQIIYTGDRITSIVDGAGRSFALDWGASGTLSSITGPDGDTKVQYQYTGNNLTGVTAPDGSHTKLEYTENKLTSVSLYDSTAATAYTYRVEYTYDNAGRIRKVTEKGEGNITGQSAFYTYNVAARTTKLENTIDNGDKTETVYTVYTFDNDGTLLGSYAYVHNGDKVQVNPSGTGINPYVNGMGYVSNTNNLLANHRFSSVSNWISNSGICSNFSRSIVTNQTTAPFGKSMLSLVSLSEEATGDGVYQLTNMLSSGEYTFSAYLKLLSDTSASVTDPGVFLRVTDTSNNVIAESERLIKAENSFIRLVLPFAITTSQSIKVWICTRGKVSVYVNAPQLEKNAFAGPYNLVENGNFERETYGWTLSSGAAHTTLDSFCQAGALRITGSLTQNAFASQDIPVKTSASVRETYTLSGWAKAKALPQKGASNDPKFQLAAKILYTDGSSEEHTADFSASTDDWQTASVTFAKEAYKTVSKITLYCWYSFESGYALFDNIQLTQNSCETGLTAEDFTTDTSEPAPDPDPDDGEEDTPQEIPGFEEVYDSYGNPITDTQFTEGEYGTIYRSMEYNTDNPSTVADDAGNDLIAETDPRGFKTKYTVNSETSLTTFVTDRCNVSTRYDYDDAGRISSMFVIDPESGTSLLSNIVYYYNAMGNIDSIGRGDGQLYTMGYDRFGKLSSVGVHGYGNLVNMTYNDSGRLKGITYPIDGQVSYVYNRYGQVISETWMKNNEITDKYRFVYDAYGNVARYIDICQKIEYTFTYTHGTVARIVISTIFLNDSEIITARAKRHTIDYWYAHD